MAAFDDIRTLERQLFFPGQRLLAADLDQVVSDHRWRRELHNRSCHQAGVGNGFPVLGEPGDREVTIGAGYALDALGHEIISTSAETEPVPPVVGDPAGGPAAYDLTVAYPSEEELEEAETRQGICAPRGVIRRFEEPVFCWVRLEEDAGGELHPIDGVLAQQLQVGLKIRLARVWVADCRLTKLSIAERRNARPPAQPYLYCDQAEVDWQVEPIAVQLPSSSAGIAFSAVADLAATSGASTFFLTADVDTSEAGFRTTPCYSVGLRGERLLRVTVQTEEGPIERVFPADGQPSVEKATPTGFTVRVLPILPPFESTFSIDREAVGAAVGDFELEVPWDVEWLGVER